MSTRSPLIPVSSSRAAVFVGRERELGELRAGWRDAVAGRGRLFLLRGDPGIGKTTLAETVAREAERDGARVAWGRCWEDGGAPALWPWIQILRTLAREIDAARRAAWLGRGADILLQLVPELASHTPPASGSYDLPPANPEAEFQVLDAIAAFLRHAAADAPLVLILDDLHAADEPSLRVLDFVARELPQHRLLVLGTYRELEARQSAERLGLLNRIGRSGHPLPIAGLSEADSRRLIELAFARSPSPGVVEALHRSTEGNPFFLDEVVRLLLASPDCADLAHVPEAGLPLPLAVRDAVRQRMQPLSEGCRRALRIAAVIGREFTLATLHAVTGEPEPDLARHLEEAVSGALLLPPTRPRGTYRFAHALLRDTLYGDLPVARRTELHTRIGQALLALHGPGATNHIAAIAHHALEGDLGAGADAVADLAVRAAQRAESLAAYGDAAHWYERARALLAQHAPGSHRCIELLLAEGAAQSKAWNTDSARQTFRAAAQQARAAVERGDLDAPLLFARAALGMSGTGVGIPRGIVDQELVDLLEAGITMFAGSPNPALEARLRSSLALELYFSPRFATRRQLMQRARELADASGDPLADAHVANARLVTEWDVAEPHDRLAHADAAIAAAVAVRDRDLEARARVFRIMDLVSLGDLPEWQREIERYAQSIVAHRRPMYATTLETLRIMTALWLGEYREAEAMCLAVLAEAERWEDSYARVSAYLQILAMRLTCGGAEELEPFVRAGAAQPDVGPEVRCAFAMLLRSLGNETEARAVYESLAREGFADLARERHLNSILAWLVELAGDYGTRQHLLALRDHLEPLSDTFLSFVSRLCFGPIEHQQGLIEIALGNPHEGERLLRVALDRSERAQGRPTVAAIRVALARCLGQRTGEHGVAEEVRSLLSLAREDASQLGMRPLLDAIEAELTRLASEETRLESVDLREAASQSGGNGGRHRARVVPFPRAAPAPSRRQGPRAPVDVPRPTAAEPAPESIFRCEGAFWTIAHRGVVLRLKGSKGLRYLAELVRAPGREVHVMDLAAVDLPPEAVSGPAGRAAGAELEGRAMHVDSGGGVAPTVDRKAREAYRRRLEDLHDELREATEFNDTGRAERVRREIDALTGELSRALGLGGRSRTQGSIVERNRLNVTRALQTAVKRIREGHPALGEHFAVALRTGTFCCYAPDANDTISWRF